MKIVYLVPDDLNSHPGILEKIKDQVLEWKKENNECWIVSIYNQLIINDNEIKELKFEKTKLNSNKLVMFFNLIKNYIFIRKIIKKINPDITYSRYILPVPFFGKINKYNKLIVEINSDDQSEFYLNNKFTGFYNSFFRGNFLGQAEGFVFVTNELFKSRNFSKYSKKRVTIGNGINVDNIEIAEDYAGEKPNVCFLCSPNQKWQGLDKIYELIKKCQEFEFHIIGPSTDDCIKLWGDDIPKNLIIHGYLSDAESSIILKKMDIGISTLALHRKKMDEACPLKLRKYLAYGLSVILAHDDPDILAENEFILKIENNNSNVKNNIELIRKFVNSRFMDKNSKKTIRNYALNRINTKEKEIQRINFFKKIYLS